MGQFWVGKRVCVTGGGGFLGSFVCEELERQGVGELFVPRQADYDLTKAADIQRCYDDSAPDMVIHLAAVVGGIGANMKHPGSYFYDNAMMGIQLIEQARQRGIEKFVALGTICAYPKFAPIPFREDELWDGYPEETNAPYGLAKKMMLVQLQAYRQQYGFNGIYLLPVNLYGPRDNFDYESSHVIPAMIRKMMDARDSGASHVTLWGDGSPTREFLYVADCARGIVAAAEHYNGEDPVNLGSGTEVSMRDLASVIAEAVGFEGDIVWDHTRPNGQPRRNLDVSRAEERFGWRSSTPFDEGVRETVAWWTAHQADQAR